MKISICIPTWEQYGYGTGFLKNNFDKFLNQTYKNFNVIISDHSKNNEIKNLCESYSDKFEIKYFKNDKLLGNGPANTNNSIIHADGEIIKIMFQDDFFYDDTSLELISEEFKKDECKWLVNGCNHTNDDGNTFYNFMSPSWNDKIAIGVNTISSPSVLSFKNETPCLFDEEFSNSSHISLISSCSSISLIYLNYKDRNYHESILNL